ncbi:hypothetical protein NT01EI_2478 [Edwardsiella ictaluri 93-146]|uniref:Uncharacterized protein n=1 Tax=Edwardsiella ictaluri (strain 93-146) TaxID=634503 RepID=C5BBU3_EDWI9|nr:hypothetical protein NT01EI_2478 [Edwardsiella ictaluri 93-146]
MYNFNYHEIFSVILNALSVIAGSIWSLLPLFCFFEYAAISSRESGINQ